MMKKTTCTVAVLAGMVAVSAPFALADDSTSSAESQTHLRKAASALARSVGINTTWAETGVSATGIASSDFLHNDMTKPAAKPLIGESSAPASVPAVVAADDLPMVADESAAPADEAPSPAAAAAPAAKPKSKSYSKPKRKSSSSSGGSRSAPSRSYSGKNVATDGGKDVYVDPIIAAPAPLFEWSIDAGYQSRYYLHGLNRVLNAGFIDSRFPDRTTEPSDTDVFYGGIAGHWNGFGGSVKYVRGTTAIETRTSQFTNLVRADYEEIVANIHYTFAVLPDGWLNATGGYRAIFFDEETFYNTDRFDDFYIRLSNTVIPYFRPSIAYHYLDQGAPLGDNDNTVDPGVKFHDGQLLVFQIDGQLGIPEKTGLPFDVVYYVQVGIDDELNVDFGPNSSLTNKWDHDWTQVGVTLPIFAGPLTISPNWSYNERVNKDVGAAPEEHFWGVNVRFDF